MAAQRVRRAAQVVARLARRVAPVVALLARRAAQVVARLARRVAPVAALLARVATRPNARSNNETQQRNPKNARFGIPRRAFFIVSNP